MFLRVDLKLRTLSFFCFVFVSFWTHVLCFTCNIETWQSLSVGWVWLSDCFSRLSPNLCCLFQDLSIEMYFTAEYLQRKHDLTWRRPVRFSTAMNIPHFSVKLLCTWAKAHHYQVSNIQLSACLFKKSSKLLQ